MVSHVTPIKAAVALGPGPWDLYWRLDLRTASVTRIGWNRDAPDLPRVQRGGVGAARRRGATVTWCLSLHRTLADLRPSPESEEDPVHRRTISVAVYQRGDYFAVARHPARPAAMGQRRARAM